MIENDPMADDPHEVDENPDANKSSVLWPAYHDHGHEE